MSEPQTVLYSLIKDRALEALRRFRLRHDLDNLEGLNRSVMRLIQASSNPMLAARSIDGVESIVGREVLTAIADEGNSNKMRTAIATAESLVGQGKKVLIWSIFRDTVARLTGALEHCGAVSLTGEVANGPESEDDTRLGRVRRFKDDANCKVLVATPAVAAEGISLHTVCHDAIYVDRNYNATQYLQSLDRIHRLGLEPNTLTSVTILASTTPHGIGNVDHSISRRLQAKISAMQGVLDDPYLKVLALQEDELEQIYDPALDRDDVLDLIEELEHPVDKQVYPV